MGTMAVSNPDSVKDLVFISSSLIVLIAVFLRVGYSGYSDIRGPDIGLHPLRETRN